MVRSIFTGEKSMSTNSETSIAKLILIPSLLTLAITVLRVVGELQNWAPSIFNKQAGGGGSILGISWLPLILGIYFAWKLLRAGEGPESGWRVILYAFYGILVMGAGGYIAFAQGPGGLSFFRLIAGQLMILTAIAIPFFAWRKLAKVLLAYAFAARIPVAILMFFAIKGNWGTHYDVAQEGFPPMHWFSKYLLIGLMPQMVIWIAFTVLAGALMAGITAAVMQRGKATRPAAA
jgi:hypothetical protein